MENKLDRSSLCLVYTADKRSNGGYYLSIIGKNIVRVLQAVKQGLTRSPRVWVALLMEYLSRRLLVLTVKCSKKI